MTSIKSLNLTGNKGAVGVGRVSNEFQYQIYKQVRHTTSFSRIIK